MKRERQAATEQKRSWLANSEPKVSSEPSQDFSSEDFESV